MQSRARNLCKRQRTAVQLSRGSTHKTIAGWRHASLHSVLEILSAPLLVLSLVLLLALLLLAPLLALVSVWERLLVQWLGQRLVGPVLARVWAVVSVQWGRLFGRLPQLGVELDFELVEASVEGLAVWVLVSGMVLSAPWSALVSVLVVVLVMVLVVVLLVVLLVVGLALESALVSVLASAVVLLLAMAVA